VHALENEKEYMHCTIHAHLEAKGNAHTLGEVQDLDIILNGPRLLLELVVLDLCTRLVRSSTVRQFVRYLVFQERNCNRATLGKKCLY
jgi:hypothetical protein